MQFVTEIFNFLLLPKKTSCKHLIKTKFFDACKTFHDKLGDIDPFEMKEELNRFEHVINENKGSCEHQIFLITSSKTIIGSFTQICLLLYCWL